MKKAAITPGVIVERVGDDLMVIVPGTTDVVSLSGRPAEVLLDVQAGREVDPSDPALKSLNDLGIVTSPGMSRRGLITAGALGAGAGVVMLSMPAAAAAESRLVKPPSSTAPSDDDASSGGPIRFRIDNISTLGGSTQGWTITIIEDVNDPNTPTSVPNGTAGTYTTETGIEVALTYDSSLQFGWVSASGQGKDADGPDFWYGELTFSIDDIDYVGVSAR